MRAVFKREFRSLFSGVSGYVASALLLLTTGSLTVYYGFFFELSSLSYILSDIMLSSALICPILCFKIFNKGDRLLSCLPISPLETVIGKYMAVVSLYAIQSLFLALAPLIFNYFGEVDLIEAYASLFVYFLFITAMAAVDLFIFSAIKKRPVAIAASYGFVAFMYVLQLLALVASRSVILDKLVSFIGMFNRFESLLYGRLDFSAMVYYLSISLFFLFLCLCSVQKKRREDEAK